MPASRRLLATTTGEPVQPARLHYSIHDLTAFEACFRELQCMAFQTERNRWVWHFDHEAASFSFERAPDESLGAVVLGSFYIHDGTAELFVRSIERAIMATSFFDDHVPRMVVSVTDIDVVNRLFSVDERDIEPETLFAPVEDELRQQLAAREKQQSDPKLMLEMFQREYLNEERRHLPEIERFPAHFYEDGVQVFTNMLKLRQRLAAERWLGRDVTMMDLILEGTAALTGGSLAVGDAQHRLRIDWDFSDDVPVLDEFQSFDLSSVGDLTEAVNNFIYGFENDSYRTWEAIIRKEQVLPTNPVLDALTSGLISFAEDDEHDPVLYINGIPRHNEPWYEMLRRIAPHLLVRPFRTADHHDDVIIDGWPRIASWVQKRARGLSLPEGVRRPLDVVPDDLRHQLWLQQCCDSLSGLGSFEATLADEEEHWRVDDLLHALRRHRDTVEFLDLTLDRLMQHCELPQNDQPILTRMVTERLGLAGTHEPFAPKLASFRWPPNESDTPIQQLSQEEIRQAILHPEPAVHRAAMWYFAGADSNDPHVASLVIESMQAMNTEHDRMFGSICLKWLVQDEQTSESLLQMITDPARRNKTTEEHRIAIALSLLAANESFLLRNEKKILASLDGDQVFQEDYAAAISDNQLEPDHRWETFTRLVRDAELADYTVFHYPVHEFVERLERLIRRIGEKERPAQWVMETLERTINDEGYDCRREMVAVNLAGTLKLEEAVPALIALLHDDDEEMIPQAVRALSRIGSESVIDGLDHWFRAAGTHFRIQAATVLQNIESERSVRTLQRWWQSVSCKPTQCRVLQALLEQFVTSDIDAAYQWMREVKPTCPQVRGLRRGLVAACDAVGRDLPDLNEVRTSVRVDLLYAPSVEAPWMDASDNEEEVDDDDRLESEVGENGLRDWTDADGDWNEAYKDWREDEIDPEPGQARRFDNDSSGRHQPTPSVARHDHAAYESRHASVNRKTTVVNEDAKIGRNDPCPCGSGKKYKKCCLKKQ